MKDVITLLVGFLMLVAVPAIAAPAPAPGANFASPADRDHGADKKSKKKDKKAGKKAEDDQDAKKPKGNKDGIQPYEDVITGEAKTDDGIFKVHRLKEKLFYEIPADQLGVEFVLVSRIARTTQGVGYGGQKLGSDVVKWERMNDRILLKMVDYSVMSDPGQPIHKAVEASNNESIIQSFDIKALGPGDAPVIDVTPLFTTDVFELSAKQRLQAKGMDKSRSFVQEAMSFPTNVEVRATHTYTKSPDPPGRPSPRSRFFRGMNPGSASVLIHYSMVRLPETPMMPRNFDERVGYFSVRFLDFSQDTHRVEQGRYITRWRLEKKDPGAALSEPVKPIVYYIDPATPTKWVPYLKAGIEQWQPAFEAAGFKNAILAKDAPTPEEDPEWHPEDARYSVVRWLPSNIENASGPHVHDPRTGEILESDIQFYHNVQNLLRSWYFIQAGPLDPRAQKFPFPDDLMGELIQYVMAHEVGHTLGFQHNMKASSLYPFEKIRDKEWIAQYSHTPTLMDYSRFNYVAQPEDGIPVKDLIPKIGPYDKWATMWGYKPIPGAKSANEEKATLDQWAKMQDDTPWYRFTTEGSRGIDPGDQTEAVGDADAVKATALGVKNLERVAAMMLETTVQPGEPWGDLEEIYGRLVGQWVREMVHVVPIVGGFDSQQKHGGQNGVRFQPISKERQEEAVNFLLESAFKTPAFMIRPDILRRIEPAGATARIASAQRRILGSLINLDRIDRLIEQDALGDADSYAPTAFLGTLRNGIFAEQKKAQVNVDPYRRNLQRAYLEIVGQRIASADAGQGDARSMLRGELKSLDRDLKKALDKTSDQATRYHIWDARDRIDAILNPEKQAAESGNGNSLTEPGAFEENQHSCWPDFIISPGD